MTWPPANEGKDPPAPRFQASGLGAGGARFGGGHVRWEGSKVRRICLWMSKYPGHVAPGCVPVCLGSCSPRRFTCFCTFSFRRKLGRSPHRGDTWSCTSDQLTASFIALSTRSPASSAATVGRGAFPESATGGTCPPGTQGNLRTRRRRQAGGQEPGRRLSAGLTAARKAPDRGVTLNLCVFPNCPCAGWDVRSFSGVPGAPPRVPDLSFRV